MKHLEIMKLLTSLESAKQILHNLNECDDYNIVQLLEMKYEKMYKIVCQNHV